MNRKILKIGLLFLLIAAIGSFLAFDIKQYTTLDYIKSQQEILQTYYEQNVALVFIAMGITYITVTAFSLPAATILTLLSGALFGLIPGLILVSFASSIGATCAFLMARFLLKDSVQKKYGKHLGKINDGFKKEGAFYLFALRLVPAVPFFMINILMSMLPIKTRIFYIVSQIGMLPGTAVYVYAGTELGKISSLADIASPTLLLAFAMLGLLPIASKKALNFLRRKKS